MGQHTSEKVSKNDLIIFRNFRNFIIDHFCRDFGLLFSQANLAYEYLIIDKQISFKEIIYNLMMLIIFQFCCQFQSYPFGLMS